MKRRVFCLGYRRGSIVALILRIVGRAGIVTVR